jgi:hypothetical protein
VNRSRIAGAALGLIAFLTVGVSTPAVDAAGSCTAPIASGTLGAPIWCQSVQGTAAATAARGANSWIDDYAGYDGPLVSMSSDYVFDEGHGPQPPDVTQHFQGGVGGHWHTDVDGNGSFVGGTVMRPNRAFGFDSSGQFIVDTEVAAGLLDYSTSSAGSMAWTELIVTTSDHLTSPNIGLYARDWFQGAWTVSLEFWGNLAGSSNTAISAQYINSSSYSAGGGTEQNYSCKMDSFETQAACPNKVGWLGNAGGLYKQCPRGSDPNDCVIRIRLRLTTNSITVYIAPEESNQFVQYGTVSVAGGLNPALLSGPVYVYQGDYQYQAPRPVRFLWDYFAINPQLAGESQTPPASTPPPTAAPQPSAPSGAAAGNPNNAQGSHAGAGAQGSQAAGAAQGSTGGSAGQAAGSAGQAAGSNGAQQPAQGSQAGAQRQPSSREGAAARLAGPVLAAVNAVRAQPLVAVILAGLLVLLVALGLRRFVIK